MTRTDRTPELTPIPGWPIYAATPDGRIWALQSSGRWKAPRVMGQCRQSNGYLRVRLKLEDGTQRPIMVHRLILLAFVGPQPTPDHETRHLDGNQLNNSKENLAWGTRLENAADRVAHGNSPRGEKNPSAKYTAETILAIRAAHGTSIEIGRRFGMPESSVRAVRAGKRWTHLGGAINA